MRRQLDNGKKKSYIQIAFVMLLNAHWEYNMQGRKLGKAWQKFSAEERFRIAET